MNGIRIKLFLAFLSIMLFAVMPQALANDEETVTTSDIIALVEGFDEQGEFTNGGAARALTMHLTSVRHFERKGATDKVIKHMGSFQMLLDQRLDQGFMTESAYEVLKDASDTLIGQWDRLTIIQDGQARAVVVTATDASERIERAAATLVEYVSKSTGVELTTVQADDEWSEGMIPIYIGISAPSEESHVADHLDSLLEDGYVIHPTDRSITIMGPKEIGTEYGVYEFLERYVGVRWLMPGEVGEDVPQHTTLIISKEDVRDEPVFLSRNMWPLQYEDQGMNYEWGIHNRLRNQNNGWDHHVWRFFSPDVYLEEHPEFYPHPDGLDGGPEIPANHHGWQPCYSNEDTIPVAVDWILNYFAQNPDESSVSLAVNDNGNYCEEYPHHEHYTGEINSIGLHDMSDIYFTWVNEVVEQVLEVYPDKWFGVLAYQEVYDPPSFSLHERVVPYLTKDRMSWSDDEVRAEDQAIVDAWNQKASNIGFYDYIYSNPYTLPRVYNHLMGDVLRYGADNNVVAFFGELAPNWGDGPKTWVLSQLLWDPYQDVGELENEWYERAVGEEAAPYLKAYFDHWTDFWENRIQDTSWFQRRKRIVYFNFDSATYLSHVTDEEIAQSREWLEMAVEKASTDKQKARAEITLKQFAYYEASALSYPRDVEPLTNAEDALTLLEESVNYQERMDYAEKRFELIDEYANDPILRHRSTVGSWSALNGSAFWALVDYIKEYETDEGPVRDRATEMAENSEVEAIRNYAQLLLETAEGNPINLNPSFEEPAEDLSADVTAKHWEADIYNYGTFERKEEHPLTGDASIYLHNFFYGDISQTVDVKPGLIVAQLNYFVEEEPLALLGTVWMDLDLLDENGNLLERLGTQEQPFSNSMGRWETIELIAEVPARVNDVPVTQVRISATINGFQEGGTMYLDDFVLHQAHESFGASYIKSAEAGNGFVEVELNKTLGHEPIASDFEVWQLSGGEPVQVSPEVTWDPAAMIATLTLPELALQPQPWEQSVKYEVTYGDVDQISTNVVSIPSLPGHTQLLGNSSFEQWSGNFPVGWTFLAEAFGRSNDKAHSGHSSLVANGLSPQEMAADGSGPRTQVDGITPGEYIAVYRFLTESEADGSLYFLIQPKDAAGNIVYPSIVSESTETKTSNGHWKTVSFAFEIDELYHNREVTGLNLFVLLNDLERGNEIYLDDIELIRKD